MYLNELAGRLGETMLNTRQALCALYAGNIPCPLNESHKQAVAAYLSSVKESAQNDVQMKETFKQNRQELDLEAKEVYLVEDKLAETKAIAPAVQSVDSEEVMAKATSVTSEEVMDQTTLVANEEVKDKTTPVNVDNAAVREQKDASPAPAITTEERVKSAAKREALRQYKELEAAYNAQVQLELDKLMQDSQYFN